MIYYRLVLCDPVMAATCNAFHSAAYLMVIITFVEIVKYTCLKEVVESVVVGYKLICFTLSEAEC